MGTLGWAAWGALADWRFRRIPNTLTLGAFLVAAAVLAAKQRSLLGGEPASALMAMGLALALTLPAYALGQLGAADAKLLAAMGLMSDLPTLSTTFLFGAFAGGFMALAVLGAPRAALVLAQWSPRGGAWLHGRLAAPSRARHLPYGSALALGFALALTMGGHP